MLAVNDVCWGKLFRGRPVKQSARNGDFCPNAACPDYGQLQAGQQQNIIRLGKTKKGIQCYRCKTCGNIFTATAGSLFFRKRTPAHEIPETLALLAERNRIRSFAYLGVHQIGGSSECL